MVKHCKGCSHPTICRTHGCAAVEYRRNKAMKCHYCEKTTDLRPYGPNGSMVCFGCAMETPERAAEAQRNFAAQLDACGPEVVIDGTEAGPYPAKHHPGAYAMLRRFRVPRAG